MPPTEPAIQPAIITEPLGITLHCERNAYRQFCAAQALAGLLANPVNHRPDPIKFAADARALADALVAEVWPLPPLPTSVAGAELRDLCDDEAA